MMSKLKKALAAVVSACLILTATGATLVAAEETKTASLDLMLVVDDTVSMQRNDPNHIATVALQQFADKIPSMGSRIGMATYDDDIMTSQPKVLNCLYLLRFMKLLEKTGNLQLQPQEWFCLAGIVIQKTPLSPEQRYALTVQFQKYWYNTYGEANG